MSVRNMVLEEVREMGPVTVRQVAEGIGWSQSMVRRTLIELEREGLVESETYQQRARLWIATEAIT